MEGWIGGWIDSVSLEYSFVVRQMDGWMDSVSLRYRKDGWMDGLVLV